MEANVLPSPEVVRELNNFVPVELYTDRPRPEDKKNQQLEQRLAKTTALPVYVVLTPDEKVLSTHEGRADSRRFAAFLASARDTATQMALR
jgi:hypothetical protein